MEKTTQVVVIGVIHKEGKYLHTLRVHNDPGETEFHNVWQIPGGGLEFGETPEEAVKREMREEVGVEIVVERLIEPVLTLQRGNWQGVFLVYLCSLENPNAEITINEESSAYAWYTLEEARNVPQMPLSIVTLERAEKLLNL